MTTAEKNEIEKDLGEIKKQLYRVSRHILENTYCKCNVSFYRMDYFCPICKERVAPANLDGVINF